MDNVNNLNGISNFGHGIAEGETVQAGITDVPTEVEVEEEVIEEEVIEEVTE